MTECPDIISMQTCSRARTASTIQRAAASRRLAVSILREQAGLFAIADIHAAYTNSLPRGRELHFSAAHAR